MRRQLGSAIILLGTGWSLAATAAVAVDEIPRQLSLEEAVRIARAHQPQLRQAHAQGEVTAAKTDEGRAPLLPQVNGNASYLFLQNSSNGSAAVVPPTMVGMQPTATAVGGSASSLFTAGVTATQLIYDFGQNWSRWRGAQATELAQRETEQATTLQVILGVRTAFFGARANKTLVAVAR